MADLLGFTALALVSLLTVFVALRYPSILKILYVALIIRIFILLIGHYITPLPDSTADAEGFENYAWHIGRDGFSYIFTYYSGPDPFFISWLMSFPYSLFGRSILMLQSISLLFGMGSIFLGWLLAKKLWNDRIANTVGWTIALFPSLVLYSVLVMREVYVCFFILLALHGVVSWIRTKKLKSIVLATIGFIGATFFHGAMFVGLIVFIIIVGISSLKTLVKSLINFRINLGILISLILIVTSSGLYVSNKTYIPNLTTLEKGIELSNLLKKTSISTRGTASWPSWTVPTTPFELLYKGPVRAIYFLFSPFPWDVKETKHLIGMFDSFLYIFLTFLILSNLRAIWKDPVLRVILILLIIYVFVFGIGVGNFGTGIRHRSKITVMLILLAAPLLKRFILFKKTDKISKLKRY